MTEKSYLWDADDYIRNSSAQQEWAYELVRKLDLRGAESVLDVGCGDGRVTAFLASLVPDGRVVGIDNSRDMISTAAASFPRSSVPNLSFHLMDATQISTSVEFDIVFSSAALHWIRNHRAVLEGIAKCLKKSGRILLQMGGKGNAAEMIEVIESLIVGDRWRPYFRSFSFPYWFYGPDEYRVWLQQVGLREIRLQLIQKDMKHSGPEGLAGWIRTAWLPYLEPLPRELRQRFIDEIVAAYTSVYPADGEGTVHVSMVRLEVEAEKTL